MKFTPTSKFLRIARGNFRLTVLHVYFRKTSTLSTALNSGSWIDATSRIVDLPDATTQIEYGLGQFSADSLTLTAKDIEWWDENVLNTTSGQYIECKIEIQIGDDPTSFATDVVNYFSGWVDQKALVPNELDDSYSLTIDTADVIADRMMGEFLSTQYYDETRGGVVLHRVPGVYVMSMNTGENPASAGVHSLHYDFNGGTPQIRYDSGVWVSVSLSGSYILTNGDDENPVTEQISAKVVYDELARDSVERSESLIVSSSPQTLPLVWNSGVSLRSLLPKIYASIGITSLTLGLSQIPSHDGGLRVSMLEAVNDAQTVKGASWVLAEYSATQLFVANANNVYIYTPATGASALLTSVASGKSISKLLYNERNGHLWILHGTDVAYYYGGLLARYDIGTSTLQAVVTVTGAKFNSLELFDFQHLGVWEYCLLYVNSASRSVMRVDGAARTVATLFANTDLGYATSAGPLSNFSYTLVQSGTQIYRIQVQTNAGGLAVHEINWLMAGDASWQDGGVYSATLPIDHTIGVYDSGIVYLYNSSARKIQKYASDGSTLTDIYVLGENDYVSGLCYSSGRLYWTCGVERQIHIYDGSTTELLDEPVYTSYHAIIAHSGRIYGVDFSGRMFQIDDTIELFLGQCDFGGKTIKNALTDTLRSTNCVGTISSAKKALVYPRGDENGDPVTSGNTIALTVSNSEDITRDTQYGAAFDIIEIDNGDRKSNYNGANFDVMPSALDERVLRIQNALIPSSVLQDYLAMFYQYFKTARVLYTIPVLEAALHIEPLDSADVTFTSTKIKKTATGCPIYSATYSGDGKTVTLGVLI
jgi:hypothetical protein